MIGKNSSQGTLTGLLIARTLEYLKENGILERYTGETKKGYAGFLWRIKDAELEEVKAGYIKYLETIGAHKPTISERNTLRMERRRAEFSDSKYLIDRVEKGFKRREEATQRCFDQQNILRYGKQGQGHNLQQHDVQVQHQSASGSARNPRARGATRSLEIARESPFRFQEDKEALHSP